MDSLKASNNSPFPDNSLALTSSPPLKSAIKKPNDNTPIKNFNGHTIAPVTAKKVSWEDPIASHDVTSKANSNLLISSAEKEKSSSVSEQNSDHEELQNNEDAFYDIAPLHARHPDNSEGGKNTNITLDMHGGIMRDDTSAKRKEKEMLTESERAEQRYLERAQKPTNFKESCIIS